jgi:hypothetical protein
MFFRGVSDLTFALRTRGRMGMANVKSTPRISGANQALIACICAMKGGARLAQSLAPQGIEQIGIFRDFSSPPEAVSRAVKKRDSEGGPTPLF